MDCIEVKAELAAQRTLMVEWFQVFLNEMKSSQSLALELKGEVLLKLESLEQKTDEGMRNAGVQAAEFQRKILGKLDIFEEKLWNDEGVKPAIDIEFRRDVSGESQAGVVAQTNDSVNDSAEEDFLERPSDSSWRTSSPGFTVKSETGWDMDNSGSGIKIEEEEEEPRSSEMIFALPQAPCSTASLIPNTLVPIPQSRPVPLPVQTVYNTVKHRYCEL